LPLSAIPTFVENRLVGKHCRRIVRAAGNVSGALIANRFHLGAGWARRAAIARKAALPRKAGVSEAFEYPSLSRFLMDAAYEEHRCWLTGRAN